jgi:hypothetical protein
MVVFGTLLIRRRLWGNFAPMKLKLSRIAADPPFGASVCAVCTTCILPPSPPSPSAPPSPPSFLSPHDIRFVSPGIGEFIHLTPVRSIFKVAMPSQNPVSFYLSELQGCPPEHQAEDVAALRLMRGMTFYRICPSSISFCTRTPNSVQRIVQVDYPSSKACKKYRLPFIVWGLRWFPTCLNLWHANQWKLKETAEDLQRLLAIWKPGHTPALSRQNSARINLVSPALYLPLYYLSSGWGRTNGRWCMYCSFNVVDHKEPDVKHLVRTDSQVMQGQFMYFFRFHETRYVVMKSLLFQAFIIYIRLINISD